MKTSKELSDLFMKAVVVAVVGGIVGAILTMVLAPINAIATIGTIISTLIVLVLVIALAKYSRIQKMSLAEFVILLAAVAVVGSIITLVVPAMNAFLLSLSALTVPAILATILYIEITSMIFRVAKIKKVPTV